MVQNGLDDKPFGKAHLEPSVLPATHKSNGLLNHNLVPETFRLAHFYWMEWDAHHVADILFKVPTTYGGTLGWYRWVKVPLSAVFNSPHERNIPLSIV